LPALLLLAGLLFTGTAPSAGVAAELPVRVLVNGRAVDFPDAQPFIDEKGRVQVPVRFVARELGARVAWDEVSATARISGHGKSIALSPGQNTATVNGTAVSLDSGAVFIENRTYVPLRFIAEGGENYEACFWGTGGGEVLILEKSAGDPSAGLTGFKKITVNEEEKPQDGDDIFVLVREQDLTGEERTFVEGVRRTKGVHHKGGLYVVALGERPNPGYGLELVKTELSWEQAKVYVRLTKPEPGKFYAAVISCPGLVGRVSLPPYTTISFIDVDTGESL